MQALIVAGGCGVWGVACYYLGFWHGKQHRKGSIVVHQTDAPPAWVYAWMPDKPEEKEV